MAKKRTIGKEKNVSLLRKTKKAYCPNLNMKNIVDDDKRILENSTKFLL